MMGEMKKRKDIHQEDLRLHFLKKGSPYFFSALLLVQNLPIWDL